MLPKPRHPREDRIVELTRVTFTIAEFCEMTGLNRAAVLRDVDRGSLRVVKVGARRLILAPQVTRPGMRVFGASDKHRNSTLVPLGKCCDRR
jgi:hypothetical protein